MTLGWARMLWCVISLFRVLGNGQKLIPLNFSPWKRALFPSSPTWGEDRGDSVKWLSRCSFSIAATWEDLRPPQPRVDWCNLVWFSKAIPRHAFILWLARLSTKEKLILYGSIPSMSCLLCSLSLESHDHLFFQYSYSSRVWARLQSLLGINKLA